MIPPADSLLKYDTPVLVSRNKEKRSPKVRTGLRRWGCTKLRWGKTDPCLEDRESRGTEAAVTGSKGNWDRRRRVGERYKKPRCWVTPKGRFRMGKKVTGRWMGLTLFHGSPKNRSGSDCPITRAEA